MKALVQNYVTVFSTESIYLTETINRIDGCSAAYWNNNISAYDIFDTVKPDIFFTHLSFFNTDSVQYLSENKNIQCVFNVTGLTQEVIDNANLILKDKGIDCRLFYSNEIKRELKSDINLQFIPLGHDLNTPVSSEIPDFNIDLGVFNLVNKDVKVPDNFKTYHILGPGEDVDIQATILDLPSYCGKYKTFVIRDRSKMISQALFTSLYHGVPTYYHDNKEVCRVVEKILKIEKSLDFENMQDHDWESIQDLVKERHTCKNRVKSIFSNFAEDIASKIKV